MKKKKVKYLYIVLALSLILSVAMAAVGLSNSQTAEAAAAAATAKPSAALTAMPSQPEVPSATPDESSKDINSDASPEAALVSSSPIETLAASETPAVSKMPTMSETPAPSAMPAASETPAASVTPSASASSDTSLKAAAVAGNGDGTHADMPYGIVKLDESKLGDTYTVDNELFGIDSTGKDARATTDGINKALTWAKEQGYKTIKFETGKYMVQCTWGDRCIPPTDGILVPSGLTLDLGGSIFIMEPNSNPEYCIFGIVSQDNVTIKNGTLIGDLDNHVFAPSAQSPTHEYGFGICISASRNVTIQNINISKMTGDGIIVEGSYSYLADGGSVSSRVRLLNNTISSCRRQGISVIGMRDSEIAGNKIYNISGVDPQYGIDIEKELDYIVDKLKIHDNVIYGCSGGAISCHSGTDYEVYNNVCSGNILTVYSSNIKLYGNTIKNSFIEVMRGSSNITVENNIMDGNSWVQID